MINLYLSHSNTVIHNNIPQMISSRGQYAALEINSFQTSLSLMRGMIYYFLPFFSFNPAMVPIQTRKSQAREKKTSVRHEKINLKKSLISRGYSQAVWSSPSTRTFHFNRCCNHSRITRRIW